ncbi:MAG: RNA polymerase sigma factor region1.1 domain-containing protein, partial [Alphaproteobacteria bacterium]|nr:RNA polymerase sigma factor region1.1 domain-containing protein [Alphaproteobacteria bacterium]
MATKQSEATKDTESNEEAVDSAVLDPSAQAVKKMIAKAKERGYVTYDEINKVLPQEELSSEQIEDIMAMMSEMGINVIDGDPDEVEDQADNDNTAEASSDDSEDQEETKVPAKAAAEVDRTDDPVRMYLREMGSVELL